MVCIRDIFEKEVLIEGPVTLFKFGQLRDQGCQGKFKGLQDRELVVL